MSDSTPRPTQAARTLLRALDKLGHTIDPGQALDLVAKVYGHRDSEAMVADLEARASEIRRSHPRLQVDLIAVEFVSSDARALDWSCRCRVISSRDDLLDWLERGAADELDEDVLEYEDGEGKSRWLSDEDLRSATIAEDGRFELPDGIEFYLIDDRNFRWTPASRPAPMIEPEEAPPSP